ncbi:MAG: EF-hand domain-containing protein [Sphingomonadaceae bacterium]|nr:EF-hand domain-containing protein [Sphingomonadaceae bacterium]
MTKAKIMAGLLAVAGVSAGLYAAPGMKADADGNKIVTNAEAMAAADARFAKMDTNSDGVLNQVDKAAKIKLRFAEIDTDKNGAISEAEFVAAHEARADKREDRREKRIGRSGSEGEMGRHGGGMRMMAMADTNGDKAISQSEFRAAAEARFARVDTNGDGTISPEERKIQRGKWGERNGSSPPVTPDAG